MMISKNKKKKSFLFFLIVLLLRDDERCRTFSFFMRRTDFFCFFGETFSPPAHDRVYNRCINVRVIDYRCYRFFSFILYFIKTKKVRERIIQ